MLTSCLRIDESAESLTGPRDSKTGALLSLGIVRDSSEIHQIVIKRPGKNYLKQTYRKDIFE